MWKGLKESEDVGTTISTSDADITTLNSRNAKADQVVQVARVVLRVIVGTLNT